MLLVSEPPLGNHCLTYFKILEGNDYLGNLPLLLLYNCTCGKCPSVNAHLFIFFFTRLEDQASLASLPYH